MMKRIPENSMVGSYYVKSNLHRSRSIIDYRCNVKQCNCEILMGGSTMSSQICMFRKNWLESRRWCRGIAVPLLSPILGGQLRHVKFLVKKIAFNNRRCCVTHMHPYDRLTLGGSTMSSGSAVKN